MIDIIKKTYLAGLGLASLTGEKIEEIVEELIKKGEVAEKDRKKIIEELIAKGREQREQLSESVKETVQKVVYELKIPRRDQYEDLLKRMEKLEKMVKPEKKVKNAPPTKDPEGVQKN
ncbi:MAG: polyhydroxyalkanoate synthesis regulator [Acidobacteriota bacterium]